MAQQGNHIAADSVVSNRVGGKAIVSRLVFPFQAIVCLGTESQAMALHLTELQATVFLAMTMLEVAIALLADKGFLSTVCGK